MKKYLYHGLIIVISLLVLVIAPLYLAGFFSGDYGVDAIASATVVIEQPSGAYVVMINPALHSDKEALDTWKKFFSGQEIDFFVEDISCTVADVDTSGLEIAKSFQSRLPENQMKLRTEDTTLMLSKAMAGRYDVLILSKEIFDTYRADYGMADAIILEGQN